MGAVRSDELASSAGSTTIFVTVDVGDGHSGSAGFFAAGRMMKDFTRARWACRNAASASRQRLLLASRSDPFGEDVLLFATRDLMASRLAGAERRS